MLDYVRNHLPQLVLMENVFGLKQALHVLIANFEQLGYRVHTFQLDAAKFFLRQARARFWIVCERLQVCDGCHDAFGNHL